MPDLDLEPKRPGAGAQGDLRWSAPLAMAAIAHEIRNPLLTVSANMELLQDQLDEHDPRRRWVDRALREVDRLAGVVDRLVDFATSRKPRTQEMSLATFLARALEGCDDLFAQKGIEAVVLPPDDDPRVRIDPELMGRVAVNLFRNAVEAMEGGGTLRIRWHARGPDRVLVRFEDTGPGVPGGMGERIFEPFVTTKPSGSGLGLAFSRRVARAHGGDLRAVEGRGGCFELELPRASVVQGDQDGVADLAG